MNRFAAVMILAGCLTAQQTGPVDRAWRLAASGQREQAVAVLKDAVGRDPKNADARLLLGSLLMEAGKGQEAITQLQEAVKLRPHSAEAQNALGEAYASAGNTKQARERFESAIAIRPSYGVAQMNLGEALVNSGEMAAAATHLDRAIRQLGRGDDAASAHYLRAKVYSSQGDLEKAEEQLRMAVGMKADFAQAWSDLGEACKALTKEDAALAAFKRAVELAPEDGVAQYRLGAEYLDTGDAQNAVEHLEAAYRLKPDDQSVLNALQRALRQEGRSREADEIKAKLADGLRRKDEANQKALAAMNLNNEGVKLQSAGDLTGALTKYRAAVELAPENVAMRVNYAIALLRLGRWTDGLDHLHRAALMDPSDTKIQVTLKEALAQAPPGSIPEWGRK